MIKAEHLRRAVDGLQQQFVFLHGHKALLPRRRFPMSHNLIHRVIAPFALPEAPLLRASLLAMMCVLHASGFRKAELVVYLPERAMRLTRTSLLWVIGGVFSKHPMPQQLQALSVGDRCKLSPRQSKCDATGEVWGDRPIALAHIDAPGNAAKALAHLELAFPVEASARQSVPFLKADNASPLTPSQADNLLASLLLDCLSPAEATRYSWHSFRIGLATRLRCAGCSPHLIQALCRWQSPKSLTFCCRFETSTYERWQSASYAAHFDITTPLNVAVGSDAHLSQLARAAPAFDFASTPTTSAAAPAAVTVSSCPPPNADSNVAASRPAPRTQ
eukprot:4004077-Pleurochrysis_carterae.AAC.1